MSNFDNLRNGNNAQQPMQVQQANPMQLLQQMKANPAQMLQQRGFNIPAGMNDPQQMVNYLIQSGQRSQGMLNQVLQRIGMRR
jgi:hypothetical protein